MDQYKSNILALLQRYKDGKCSREELEYLYDELSTNNDDVDKVLWESLLQEVDTAKLSDQKFEDLYQKISSETIAVSKKRKVRRLIPLWAAAAVLLICLFGLYLYNDTFQKTTRETRQYTKLVDVAPGSNKAVLKTADGSVIVLNEAQDGIIMGDEIIYTNGSEVTQVTESTNALEVLYELSTPNSGTYRVTLDDGSTVWLNAASKLIYPSKFSRHERKVVIEGEAYFEIQKDPTRPFKVTSGDQTVEVLGTTFNISAYPDERAVRTTLVEGKVKVGQNGALSSSVYLYPGQQSILKKGSEIKVKQVNLMEQVGWREGLFYFDETALTDAMLQISRWYDIEIRYDGDVSQTYFYGEIPRSKSLKNVLNILEEGNVRFRLTKEKTKNVLTVLSTQ
ncbi:FecR domain-containing protein [Sphingobacterium sp. DN00404]|uniref:FecR domain-containing protein n=1 Tax=Sphingobacterium micropteri TaxID=2763501 RepID=A0ABR7YL64_9SPHI|nr:FecR family protein [Sphingobacterium micropteri]MBD1432062.1 FecR domain-containing protein [Sphingobacterium micropteri]